MPRRADALDGSLALLDGPAANDRRGQAGGRRRRGAGCSAAQAVFDNDDLRRHIFGLRLRDLFGSLVKWGNLARGELRRVEKRADGELSRMAMRRRNAEFALAAACRAGDKKAWFRPEGRLLGHAVRTPEAQIRAAGARLQAEVEQLAARRETLREARACLTSACWPRKPDADAARMQRKLRFVSTLALRTLRRSVDAVLRGTALHAEFVAAVGRPRICARTNPPGTARSQADLHRFFAA